MEHPISLNHAHIILEAVRLSTGAEITLLQQLIATNPTVLKPDIILRVLLSFLPESTDPVSYVDLLRNLSRGSTIQVGEHVQIPKPEISDDEANQRVRKLRLQPLADPHCVDLDADPLTLFLFHRARQIDAETGSLPLVLNLIKPFVSHSEWILTWAVSTLLPLLRLQYEYYPHDGPMFSLDDFEALDGNHAIDSLLSEAKREKREAVKTNIGRDLRGLIGPWIYGENSRKRRKLNKARIQGDAVPSLENEAMNDDDVTHDISRGWNHVNKWLLDLALIDFPRVAEAVVDWDGPHDVDYGDWASRTRRVNEKPLQAMTFRYAQAALAAVYATSNCSSKTLEYSLHILQKVVNISDLKSLSDLTKGNTSENQGFTPDFFKSLSPSYLLHDTLLEPQNPFTIPTEVSVRLCHFLLFSIKLLQNLARQQNCKTLAELSLFGDGATQLAEVRKILNQPRDPENWRTVRVDLLKLWNWSYVNDDQMVQEQENLLGVFCKIERVDLEIEILKALLHTSCKRLSP